MSQMEESKESKEYDFEATLVFIVYGKKVLLAPKNAKIGKGLFNGYGGEIEKYDISVEFRATLEMWQECGMICDDENLQKVAIGYFTNIKDNGEIFVCKVHVFLVEKNKCVGVAKATREMNQPQWFDIEKLPFNKMMAADKYWLREIFKGKKIIISATLKNKQSELVGDVEIIEVESFD
jgi:8-oxo-dGTP diphosphatase/2-hydroxy-dATP diphosphatase